MYSCATIVDLRGIIEAILAEVVGWRRLERGHAEEKTKRREEEVMSRSHRSATAGSDQYPVGKQ